MSSGSPALRRNQREVFRRAKAKGSGSRIATLTMVFKLGLEAREHWRRLNGPELLAKVVTGIKFVDGEEQIQEAA